MLHKNLRKLFQCSMLATAMLMGFASLTQAAEARSEDQAPTTQPASSQPPQQATPAKPAVEPVDEDDGTALA